MSFAWYGLSDLLLVERQIDDEFSWPANDGVQKHRRGCELRMCCMMHAVATGERLGAPMRALEVLVLHANAMMP